MFGIATIITPSCILLVFQLVHRTSGFKSGAPKTVCSTRIPGHSPYEPQVDTSPYVLNAELSNGNVQVTISSNPFRGFLLRARGENGGNDEFLGQFSVTAISKNVCTESDGQGLTHSDATVKINQSFTWLPPNDFCGNIVFEATVVESFKIFWVGISSQPALISNGCTTTEGTPSVTENFNLTSVTAATNMTTHVTNSTTTTLTTTTAATTTQTSASAQNGDVKFIVGASFIVHAFLVVFKDIIN